MENGQRLYIGTTNPRPGEGVGEGIFVATFSDGVLSAPELVTNETSPSFLVLDAEAKRLYAVLGGDYGNATAAAYEVPEAGKGIPQTLRIVSQADCGSTGGCHLSLSPDRRTLFTANYTGATLASFHMDDAGMLSVATLMTIDPRSAGPHNRQEAPHPHWAEVSPGGDYLLMNDLGLDCIFIFQFDAATGTFSHREPDHWNAEPGAGPRHSLIHPNGKWIYNINELNSTINQLQWSGENGTLTLLHTVATVPAGMDVPKLQACEMIFSADLRFLYASNRVHQSFVVYTVDARTGRLELLQELLNPGRESRHIAIDPTGHWFLSANQFSGDISVFPLDPDTGRLEARSSFVKLDGPSCLLFG